MSKPAPFIPRDYVFSSGDATSTTADAIERARAGAARALALNMPELRDYFVPVSPGDFCAVIGQTSNFKTGFMRMWQNEKADELMISGRRAAIISIHTEETLEAVIMQEVVRVAMVDMRLLVTGKLKELEPVHMALSFLGTIPIIRIAYSAANIPDRPTLNLTNIAICIEYACKTFEIEDVAAIYLDYLQAVANEDQFEPGEDQFRIRVRNNVFSFRRILQRYRAPGVLGVQGTTDLRFAYSKIMRIPSPYDGQETSAIGQHAQRCIGLWLPKMTPQVDSPITFQEHKYTITDDLIFVWVSKQQGNLPSGKVFAFKIDYKKHWFTQFPWNVVKPNAAQPEQFPGFS